MKRNWAAAPGAVSWAKLEFRSLHLRGLLGQLAAGDELGGQVKVDALLGGFDIPTDDDLVGIVDHLFELLDVGLAQLFGLG